MIGIAGEGTTQDGLWHYIKATNQATPTQSYYVLCADLPSVVAFGNGASGGATLYTVRRENM
jgi:hypothetical protein